jgi:hypothetical protein
MNKVVLDMHVEKGQSLFSLRVLFGEALLGLRLEPREVQFIQAIEI